MTKIHKDALTIMDSGERQVLFFYDDKEYEHPRYSIWLAMGDDEDVAEMLVQAIHDWEHYMFKGVNKRLLLACLDYYNNSNYDSPHLPDAFTEGFQQIMSCREEQQDDERQ